jgi:hypothetical protein
VVVGWGVAQYPWVLVDELHLDDRPAPGSTEVALLAALGLAVVLVVPSLAWLLRLTDVGSLTRQRHAASSDARLAELQAATIGPPVAPGPDDALPGPGDGPASGSARDDGGAGPAGWPDGAEGAPD